MTHHDPTPDRPQPDEPIDFTAHRRRRIGGEPGTELDTPYPSPASTSMTPVEMTKDDNLPDPLVLTGEIVDRPDNCAVGREPVWRSGAQVRPVLPLWMTSLDNARSAAKWVWSCTWRTTAFHTIRVPAYAGTLALRSPRGLGRAVAASAGWVFDRENAPVRAAAVARADVHEHVKVYDRRNDRVRLRLILAGVALIAGCIALAVLLAQPEWARYLAAAATIGLLGWLGSPADKPLISRAVIATQAQKLTSDVVVRALASLGIAQINQAVTRGGGGITFPAPITRDGPGWRADVDLPYGVTVTDIAERRDKLASGLRRPIGCVWPEPAHDAHAGRLVLWVGDEDLSRAKHGRWPLLAKGRTDMFAPLPFGTDPRGRVVSVVLFENNVLVGALPGAGKTATVRVFMLAAALDPTCEVWVYDFKGMGDLEAAEKFAHRYVSGIDDASIEAGLQALRDLKDEVMRRAAALKKIPRDRCPDGKLTRQLANAMKTLRPLVAIFDEVQNLFAHPEFGKEAGELAEFIIKLGRALGVILVLATQRPDKDSVPTGVSGNVSVRFCLRVTGQVENDMILGTSAYKNGIRATTLRPTDRGVGYLVGAADDPLIVKSAYLDKEQANKVAERARALRIAHDGLTGFAAGQDTDTRDPGRAFSVLDDVAAVITEAEPKVWSETVVARLAELRPEVYGRWKPEQLAAALKPHGITVGRQVWGTDPTTGKAHNRKGIHRDEVAAAITERNRKRNAG